ncbi:MAG: hypothetical protein NVSMB25_20810 [Thermoleophilaceae bacterium]
MNSAVAADFPSARGKTIAELRRGLAQGPILAATVSVLTAGQDRFGFGLFDSGHRQIQNLPVALYVERSGTSVVSGPFPARQQSLAVSPPFQSQTVAKDPDAARSFYVANIRFPGPGAYAVQAIVKDGGHLVAANVSGAQVSARDPVPAPGQPAPRVDTPTVASAHGNLASIDTRVPPDSMHSESLASVLGKKPVVLLFSTPALCQSRVCGPVADITEEVRSAHQREAAFIHNEIYLDNTIKPGCLEGMRPTEQCFRPQVVAYHLPTEPWLFAIDRHGRVAARLEGAFGKPELEAALRTAVSR